MNKRWYVIYRNGSTEVENMITGYASLEEAKATFEMWARWDACRATSWQLVSFPRTREPRVRRKRRGNEPDTLEFHDVLDDLDLATEDKIKTEDHITIEELRR
jgi:hypothetical protein